MTIRGYHPTAGKIGRQAPGLTLVRQAEKPVSRVSGEDEHVPASLERASTKEARVAELRSRYREGIYQVNDEELSAHVVERHLEKETS